MSSIVFIFLLVFGAFGWYLYKALRLTRNTVGENSPLYVQRTYHVSAWGYFTSLNRVVSYMFYPVGPILLILLLRANWSGLTGSPLYLVGLVVIIAGLVWMSLMSYRLLLLDLNHWKYTRDKTLLFDPADYSLTVQTPDRTISIRQEDIAAIEYYYSDIRFFGSHFYYRLKLMNDDEVVLTSSSKGLWALSEYFKNVPLHSHRQNYPIIQ
ncbi:hypothetical protein [Telluribacter sp. SYSU D00476]|uniref:hypothetical protein n=1 Tax=Telluribacter sp. SYSU D00476 TaxID=2811430 RepID=UPI001FF450EC|nr:hypothetical protein [Telluribacter sp. SYSU D00476]